jgi:hypothetical protein
VRRRVAGAIVGGLVLLAGCGGGDEGADGPDPADLEGAWDVSLVIGRADTAPGGEAPAFPADTTFRERWVFEACDETGCTLRRPDGGFVFGDLDDVRVALGAGLGLDADDGLRLVGLGAAAAVPPAGGEDASPCDGAATERWAVRVELGLTAGVLSGSAFRTPEALQAQVAGVACFGHDLTLGLSGTPAR